MEDLAIHEAAAVLIMNELKFTAPFDILHHSKKITFTFSYEEGERTVRSRTMALGVVHLNYFNQCKAVLYWYMSLSGLQLNQPCLIGEYDYSDPEFAKTIASRVCELIHGCFRCSSSLVQTTATAIPTIPV